MVAAATVGPEGVDTAQHANPCWEPTMRQPHVMVLALFPFPAGKAVPEDPDTFLEMAFEAEGTELRFG